MDTAESTTADGSIGKDNCSEDQEDKEEKEKEPKEEEAGDVLNEQLSEEALSANQENNLSEVEHAPNDISWLQHNLKYPIGTDTIDRCVTNSVHQKIPP